MADSNQKKADGNNSDIELDPVVQGANRVHEMQEQEGRLDTTGKGEDTQDTQTRSNIHLGGRQSEGKNAQMEDTPTYPSASTDNTEISGSPVHTNFDQAEAKLTEMLTAETAALEAAQKGEVGTDNAIFSSGTATSELDFDRAGHEGPATQPGLAPAAVDFAAERGVPFQQNINDAPAAVDDAEAIDENDAPVGVDGVVTLEENDAPVAVDDAAATDENETLTLNVLNNDTDADNDTLIITDAIVEGGLGAVSHDGTNITFNPGSAYDHLAEGESETATITYTVSDGVGGTDTANLTVTMTGSNDGPIAGAVDLSATLGATLEDTSITFSAADLLANSSDIDGDSLSVTDVSVDASFGTVTDNGDGTYSFAPAENYNGDDVPLSFTVSDGLASSSATASIDVTAVNDGPAAGDDAFAGAEDQAIAGTVISNDTDVDGDSLSVIAETIVTANGGTVELNADGTFSYNPAADFNGTDSFSYTLSDGTTTDTGSVTLEVSAVNDGPIAGSVDLSATLGATLEDTSITFSAADLLANSSDIDGDSLSVTDVSVDASFGTVTDNGDGTYSFAPAENYNGDDVPLSFTVSDGLASSSATASIDVTAVADAPILTVEDSGGIPITLKISGDHYDPNNVEDVGAGSPQFQVFVNGEAVVIDGQDTFSVESERGDWDLFRFEAEPGTDINSVEVKFINDAWDGGAADYDGDGIIGEDRNLIVDKINIGGEANDNGDFVGGHTIEAEDAYYDKPASDGYETMPWSGSLSFDMSGIDRQAVASGHEDTAISLNINAALSDASESLSIIISGVPEGAVLSAGTNNGDGSWNLTADQLDGLNITPAENYNGSFDLSVAATSTVGADSATTSTTLSVSVSTVNDGPVMDAVEFDDISSGLSLNEEGNTGEVALVGELTDFPTDAITVQLSFTSENPPQASETNGVSLFSYAVPGSHNELLLFAQPNDMLGVYINGQHIQMDIDSNALFDGESHDLAVSWDSETGEISVFVDGNLADTATAQTGNLLQAGGTMTLGQEQDTVGGGFASNQEFSGEIHSLEVFSEVRSAEDIANDAGNAPEGGESALVLSFDFAADDPLNNIAGDQTLLLDGGAHINTPEEGMVQENSNGISGRVFAGDVEGDNLTFVLSGDPAEGSVTVEADGTFHFVPGDDFQDLGAGEARETSFEIEVSDGQGGSDTQIVTVTVTGQNDGPVAESLAIETLEDNVMGGQLVASDIEGDNLTFALAAAPNEGAVTVNADGSFHFTPGEDFQDLGDGESRDVTFSYEVSDGQGGAATETVTVTVNGTNDAPVIGNITNVDGSSAAPEMISGVAMSFNEDGRTGDVAMVENIQDFPTDALTIELSFASEDPPQASETNGVSLFSYAVPGSHNELLIFAQPNDMLGVYINGQQIQMDVGMNDLFDGEYHHLAVSWDSETGEISVFVDGSLADTATAQTGNPLQAGGTMTLGQEQDSVGGGFASNQEFSGTIADVQIFNEVRDPAQIEIDAATGGIDDGDASLVHAYDFRNSDGDVVSDQGADNDMSYSGAVVIEDSGLPDVIGETPLEGAEDGGVITGNLTATDVDGDDLTFALLADTAEGSVTVDGDGNFTFDPGADFQDLGVGETREVSFTYQVSDGQGGTDTTTASVTVIGSNDGPIAGSVDLSATLGATLEDTSITFSAADLLANSSDVDGDSLSVTDVSVDASFGTVTDNGDGTYSFAPAENYNGDDVPLSFTVSDGLASSSATASIDVTAVNDGPAAGDDAFAGAEDQAIAGNVISNDTDVDGDSLSVIAETIVTANGGTVELNADGTFSYNPAADFNGTDSFSYTLSDGTTTDTGSVTLEVSAVNDGPIAGSVDLSATLGATLEDTSITFSAADLLANSSDVDGDSLSVTDVSVDASFGTVTDNGDGTYSFAPAENYNGDDVPLSFTVSDGLASSSATASIGVTAVNDGPVIGAVEFDPAPSGLSLNEEGNTGDVAVLADIDNFPTDAFTIQLGFTSEDPPQDSGKDGVPLFSYAVPGSSNEVLLFAFPDGNLGVHINGERILMDVGMDDLYDGEYHHLAVSWDSENGEISVFVDGNLADTATAQTGNLLQAGGTMTLGQEQDTVGGGFASDQEFSGKIHSLEIFSEVRSAEDIANDVGNVPEGGESALVLSFDFGADDPLNNIAGDQVLNLGGGAHITSYDVGTTMEDGSTITGNLTATDVDGDDLTFTLLADTAEGSVTVDGDGNFAFDPGADFQDLGVGETREVSFTYQVSDGQGGTDTATASVTVMGSNDGPIVGTSGNDTITGTTGDDVIIGMAGDDTLSGGIGDDVFEVGLGHGFDAFDGGTGTDQIAATADNVQIGFYHNFDLADSVEEITGDGHMGVTIAGDDSDNIMDFSGTILTDIDHIEGGVGNDTITGSAGDDVIIGEAGNDTLYGGAGNDIFQVGLGDGFDAFDGGSGTDQIVATADNVQIGFYHNFDLDDSIEEITGNGHTGVTIVGDAGRNTMDFSGTILTDIDHIDGGADHDSITGSAGDDVIIGGTGNDSLYGGAGDDIFQVGLGDNHDIFEGGSGTDQIVATADNAQIGFTHNFDLADSIEEITSNGHTGVTIAGDSGNNTLDFSGTILTDIDHIDGGGGYDTITGSASDDVIIGGANNDTMHGGAGDDIFQVGLGDGADIFDGGSGTDQIVATADNTQITLDYNFDLADSIEEITGNGHTGVTISGDSGHNTLDFSGTILTDIDHIDGGAGNDVITGSAGDDVIIGGTSNDTLSGGAGNDVFQVGLGHGTDTFDGGSGTDQIAASEDNVQIGIYSSFGSADSIEEITSNGHTGVNITGSWKHNVMDFSDTTLTGIGHIDGGGGKDTITGSAGDDVIIGGTDNDVMFGGAGNDVFQVGVGHSTDSFDGGSGTDQIAASEDNAQIGIEFDFDSTNSIEEITSNGHTGVNITGSWRSNELDFSGTALTGIGHIDGGGGNDTITGTAGDDVIIGGADNDTLYGGAGDDIFQVGVGHGSDDFDGGSGIDQIAASEDNTRIVFENNFNPADSIEEITSNGHTGVTVNGSWRDNVMDFSDTTLTGIDYIDGGAANDTITGSAGDDAIIGGTGNDTLSGGLGNDTFIFEAQQGNDTVSGGSADGWTDVIQLDGFTDADSQQGWTLTLDDGSTISSTDEDANEILLSEDSSGTITFDDGGTIDFDGVEKIIW